MNSGRTADADVDQLADRMKPALLHADATECGHEGSPQATVHDDGGPLCPAGQPVTHVLFNGRRLTVSEMCVAFDSMAKTIINAIAPFVDALIELGRVLGTDPAIRALTAMAEIINEERQREGGPS